MMIKTVKTILLAIGLAILAVLSGTSHANAAENIDWQAASESLYEDEAKTTVTGTSWGLYSRRENIQVTFKLNASNDGQQGRWIGDIRAPEKFFVKLYVLHDSGLKKYIKLDGLELLGPDASYGYWKDGPSTIAEQAMIYNVDWDQILGLKNGQTLVVNYASFDSPKDFRDIKFPLEKFSIKLAEVEAAIAQHPNPPNHLMMTAEHMESTPMNKLPMAIQNGYKDDFEKISAMLERPVSELKNYSLNDIKGLLDQREKAKSDARRERKKQAHQAIYDQEPEWLDINICPKPDVSYCRNVGKTAYETDSMFGNEYNYGEILGVVWRSKGSIIKIYGGSLDYDIDPKISRAGVARYYYIARHPKGYIEVRPCDAVDARG